MYITIAEDGSVRAWQTLTDEDIEQLIGCFYVVVKVEVEGATTPVKVYDMNESGDKQVVKISPDIDGFLDP